METADRDLLENIASYNPQIRKLYNHHLKLDKEVQRFTRYAVFSSSAALKQKELKKQKLRGMDELMQIVSRHRVSVERGSTA